MPDHSDTSRTPQTTAGPGSLHELFFVSGFASGVMYATQDDPQADSRASMRAAYYNMTRLFTPAELADLWALLDQIDARRVAQHT